MSTNTNKQILGLSPMWAIALGVVVALVVAGVIGFAVLSTMTDGTEKYTGAKLEAARLGLQVDQGSYSPALFSGSTKAHVESVRATPAAQGCTANPDDPYYYSVTVRRAWLFGATYGSTTYNLCRSFGR